MIRLIPVKTFATEFVSLKHMQQLNQNLWIENAESLKQISSFKHNEAMRPTGVQLKFYEECIQLNQK